MAYPYQAGPSTRPVREPSIAAKWSASRIWRWRVPFSSPRRVGNASEGPYTTGAAAPATAMMPTWSKRLAGKTPPACNAATGTPSTSAHHWSTSTRQSATSLVGPRLGSAAI